MGDADGPGRRGALGREALAYADALYNLARYLAGNDADAEDLVQETYANALRAAGQFEPGTNLKAWLFRILRNAFISRYRRRRRDPTVGGLDTADPRGLEAAGAEWPGSEAEEALMRNIVSDDIEKALMRLPEEARTVVLMDLEGFTEAEVSRTLGCAVGTVKSRLARARSELRQLLRDYAR